VASAGAPKRFPRSPPSAGVRPSLVDDTVPLWQAGRFDALQQVLKQRDSVLSRALQYVVAHRARWPADELATQKAARLKAKKNKKAEGAP